jgi:branched-subunit amino acid aminotransferase/4-amino-4-deoxychorismate lyase
VPTVDHHTVLRWSEHGLVALAEDPRGAVLVADSWLVADGAVRGYDAHWARFCGCCDELGLAPDLLARFRAAVSAALPRAGRWFPRIELAGSAGGRVGSSPDLRLRLRPAQPPASRARVIVAEPGDLRGHPRWKGPDIELLHELRAQAVAAGADELLLCDAGGRLLEGAFTSLLWWEGDALCTTPDERTLPGITRLLLLQIARERGTPTRVRAPLAHELADCETWLTNAAHGICVVGAWGPEPAAPAPRAADWRAALDRTARPL